MRSLPKPRWAWALAALILGTAYSVWLLGWRSLDVTNLDWLHGDANAAYLGWAFFRQEDGLNWPLTWSSALNYPFGVSTSFADMIPLVALFLKPIQAFLPEPFQYFGWWIVLCGSLQSLAGFLLARRLGAKNALEILLSGLLFLTTPVLMMRFNANFALASQWLVLLAFYLYLPPSQRLANWLALIFLAGLINPYLSAMVLMIFAAFLLKARAGQSLTWRHLFGWASAASVVLLSGWLLAGFLVIGRPAGFEGGGLGYYSANLLTLIDPGRAGALLGRTFTSGYGQYEGFGYLGAGVLLLLAMLAIKVRSLGRREDLALIKPLLPFLVLALLLALSSKVTFSRWEIVDYGDLLPDFIKNAWSVFRASGRFIWLIHYTLLIAALLLLFRLDRKAVGALALSLVMALQIYDLTLHREAIRKNVTSEPRKTVKDEIWTGLGKNYRHLVALPAWQCGGLKGVFGKGGYWGVGLLALREDMTTNSHYVARGTPEGLRYNCGDLVERVVEGERLPDSAYVFSLPLARTLVARGLTDGCRLVDDVVLCAEGLPEIPPAEGWHSLIAAYSLGMRLDLSNANSTDRYLGAGWTERAAGAQGVSTIGSTASLVFKLTEPIGAGRNLKIELGMALGRGKASVPLEVKVNGVELASYQLPVGEELPALSIALPADLPLQDGVLEIEFQLELPAPLDSGSVWPQHRLYVWAIEIR